ncbi:agmatine deiminase family protein [Nannocystaceae bacterium ST9]
MDAALRLLLASWAALGGPSAPPADAVPEMVPRPVILQIQPVDGRTLRGDWEIADQVFMVYTEAWQPALDAIGREVLASGTPLGIVIETGNRRKPLERWVAELTASYGEKVDFFDTVVDTPWIRDWGPVQVSVDAGALWLDTSYEDDDRLRDDLAPQLFAHRYGGELAELGWAIDGGAFISNGRGLCMLTREYLDNEMLYYDDDHEMDALLGELGCRVVALVPTLVDEDTKHADMIAQFVGPGRVMVAEIDPALALEDSLRLDAVVLGLHRAAALMQLELEVIRVPTPVIEPSGAPRTYVNGLRLRDRYLMPSYPELGEAMQADALAAVQDAMGSVKVVPVVVSEMIHSGGAIHCAALGLFQTY